MQPMQLWAGLEKQFPKMSNWLQKPFAVSAGAHAVGLGGVLWFLGSQDHRWSQAGSCHARPCVPLLWQVLGGFFLTEGAVCACPAGRMCRGLAAPQRLGATGTGTHRS